MEIVKKILKEEVSKLNEYSTEPLLMRLNKLLDGSVYLQQNEFMVWMSLKDHNNKIERNGKWWNSSMYVTYYCDEKRYSIDCGGTLSNFIIDYLN